MKGFNKAFCVAAILGISGCSQLVDNTSTPIPNYDALLQAQTKQNGRACIRESDINGYGVLADDVISVSVSKRNQYFLVSTLYRCHSLSISPAIVFSGSFSEFCGGGHDKILTVNEACPVQNIFEFSSREAAFDAFEKAKHTRDEIRESNKKQEINKEAKASK